MENEQMNKATLVLITVTLLLKSVTSSTFSDNQLPKRHFVVETSTTNPPIKPPTPPLPPDDANGGNNGTKKV